MEEVLVDWVTVWFRCEGDVGAVGCQRTEIFASRLLQGLVEVDWVALDAILT
jgi:hypothetical protein